MDHLDLVLAQWGRERPDLDVGPMGLIGRVLRLSRHLMRDLEATLAQHGLNFASFDVLATLRRAGPPFALSPNDLLGTMMITSGTMTHRVDQLEKAGHVRRRPNPADGRSVLIALTPAGRALVDGVLGAQVATQARLVAHLDAAQRAALGPLLSAWLGGLEPLPAALSPGG
ncbi:MAG: MarR family transcriptional regulator [Roseococcus sp.]|nr:MarR family transcriptional regulator [Roseococcus sp.]